MLWKRVHGCALITFAEEIMCVTHGYSHPDHEKSGIEMGYAGTIFKEPSCIMVWIPYGMDSFNIHGKLTSFFFSRSHQFMGGGN